VKSRSAAAYLLVVAFLYVSGLYAEYAVKQLENEEERERYQLHFKNLRKNIEETSQLTIA
jgi:hypothetical protein